MSKRSQERAERSPGKVHTAYDSKTDGLWVYRNGYVRNTVEIHPRILLDFGPGGKLMGIEVIDASKGMSTEELADFHFQPRKINRKSQPTVQQIRTYKLEFDD